MMRCLAHAPILLRRGRSAFAADDVSSLIQLRDEIGEMYVRCKSELDTLRLQLQWELPSQYTTEEHIVRLVHAYRHRAYGLGLSIVLIFNTMLSVLCLDSGVVEGDAVRFAEEAATLARNAAVYRPIGASYAVLCLAAAGAATAEVRVRGEIEDLLRDYLQDVGGGTEADVKGMLEQTGRRLRFGAGGHSRGCYNI